MHILIPLFSDLILSRLAIKKHKHNRTKHAQNDTNTIEVKIEA